MQCTGGGRQTTTIVYSYEPLYRLKNASYTGSMTAACNYVYDSVGNMTAYDPYGRILAQTGQATGTLHGTTYAFTGEQFDGATNLLYLRARYYNPGLKIFMSRDSFPGYAYRPVTLHDYAYVSNNPVNKTDHSGLCEEIADEACWSLYEQIVRRYPETRNNPLVPTLYGHPEKELKDLPSSTLSNILNDLNFGASYPKPPSKSPNPLVQLSPHPKPQSYLPPRKQLAVDALETITIYADVTAIGLSGAGTFIEVALVAIDGPSPLGDIGGLTIYYAPINPIENRVSRVGALCPVGADIIKGNNYVQLDPLENGIGQDTLVNLVGLTAGNQGILPLEGGLDTAVYIPTLIYDTYSAAGNMPTYIELRWNPETRVYFIRYPRE